MRRSITEISERHSIIDKRKNRYLSFPDVYQAENDTMIAVYREADHHVATWSRLLYKKSRDHGKTWSEPIALNEKAGHCPRISNINGNQIVIIDDGSLSLYRSTNCGETFSGEKIPVQAVQGLCSAPMEIPDRVLQHENGRLSVVSQVRLGTRKVSHYPTTGQAQWVNMFYVSDNDGASWTPVSIVSGEKDLSFCEVSVCRLPDGRLLSMNRENTGVYEPMYITISEDEGESWSPAIPTPLIGHRPCVGVTSEGKILVTYRSVGPDRGTCAWLGTLEEMAEDYAVHGISGGKNTVSLEEDGLHIRNEKGTDAKAFYCLRPISNPFTASAELTVRARAVGDSGLAGIQFAGIWWSIASSCVAADKEGVKIPLSQTENLFYFVYRKGKVFLSVNGIQMTELSVKPCKETRTIGFGNQKNATLVEENEETIFNEISLSIDEPSYLRNTKWNWAPHNGIPDAYSRDRILELKNASYAWGGDYGYTGWCEINPGEFYCVCHHIDREGAQGRDSYVLGTRFYQSDFADT